MTYIDKLNSELKEYLFILSNKNKDTFNYLKYEFDKYIKAKSLNRLKGVGMFCGVDYQKIPGFDCKYWYSRLDHSISCAYMTYNFTNDYTQSISALFHDMGTPAFSHCVDFMLNDAINQESSEKNIHDVISMDNELLKCLNNDKINIDDVVNLEKYTIVENKKPKLCVDRLDGIFSTGLIWQRFWNLSDIEEIYKYINVSKNEYLENEISFSNLKSAEKFYKGAYNYSIGLQKNNDKISMKYMGDLLSKAIDNNIFSKEELYILTEKHVIRKILNCNVDEVKKMWDIFTKLDKVYNSDIFIEDKYCISLESKKRYVNPLCNIENNTKRLCDISKESSKLLKKYMKFKDSKYAYIDYKIN